MNSQIPYNHFNQYYVLPRLPEMPVYQQVETSGMPREQHALTRFRLPNKADTQVPGPGFLDSRYLNNPSLHSNTSKTSYTRHQLRSQAPSPDLAPTTRQEPNRRDQLPQVLLSNASSPPIIDSRRPSSRASMATLVDPVVPTPIASSGGGHDDKHVTAESDEMSREVKAKDIEKGISLGGIVVQLDEKPKRGKAPKNASMVYGMPTSKAAALRQYCLGHKVQPSLESRTAWANLNNIARPTLNKAIRGILKTKPSLHTSSAPWELPLELVPNPEEEAVAEEVVVKEECIDVDAVIVMETDVKEGLDVKVQPSVVDLTDQQDATMAGNGSETTAQPSAHIPLAIVSDTSTSQMTLARATPGPLELALSSGINVDISVLCAPTTFNQSTDHEMMKYLLDSSFFQIVQGPHAITLEDMVDWSIFEAKLAHHKSSFGSTFAWRALKRFYFYF